MDLKICWPLYSRSSVNYTNFIIIWWPNIRITTGIRPQYSRCSVNYTNFIIGGPISESPQASDHCILEALTLLFDRCEMFWFQDTVLGISSLSMFGTVGAAVQILLILYPLGCTPPNKTPQTAMVKNGTR